jgi:Ni,Fe-hydrogenase III small subunit
MNKKKRQKIISENTQKADLPTRRHSVFIRHLDCGSCNGCELELTALTNPVYDIGQYGIDFTTSPRHAYLLAITGIFTRNLAEAAQITLDAMPMRQIITIGDCAKDGGDFQNSYAIAKRPDEIEKNIKMHVPGCPPDPIDILKALFDLAENDKLVLHDVAPYTRGK